MKKIVLIVLSFCIITYIIVCRIIASGYDYPIGRDTVKAFGNREYQIINLGAGAKCLCNEKYRECILEDLVGYKKYGSYVYFCPYYSNVYIKLNVKDNKILYCCNDERKLIRNNKMYEDGAIEVVTSFDELSEEDRVRFCELEESLSKK